MDFRFRSLILISLLVALTYGAEANAALAAKDVAAIRAVDAAYVKAVMARDWEALAALLTPDGVVMPPNQPEVVGRGPNLARLRGFNLTSVEYAHVPGHVDGKGNVAYLQGSYTIKMTFPNVPQPLIDRGKYLWVLKKQSNGTWLIERIIWNTDLPQSAG